MKALMSSKNDEVEFTKMSIDDEIIQLESYLPKEYTTLTLNPKQIPVQASLQDKPSTDDLQKIYTTPAAPLQESSLQAACDKEKPSIDHLPKKYTSTTASLHKKSLQAHLQYIEDEHAEKKNKLALANVKIEKIKKLPDKEPGDVWDIITFMDTGGQPQFISMLPAVNSFAMITFIVHKIEKGGQSLKKTVKVQYGNKKGKISYKPHPHKYTYLQLIETLISYSSNILPPDTKFLEKVKIENEICENTRSILLTGTHSGDKHLSETDIKNIDEELTKTVEKSRNNCIKPQLNKNYQFLVPVDNEKQGKIPESTKKQSNIYRYTQFLKNKVYQVLVPGGKNLGIQTIEQNTKRYTNPSDIRKHIQKFLNSQDKIHVPIKWLLLELEIRKVCQEKNYNLMSYDNILKLAIKKN